MPDPSMPGAGGAPPGLPGAGGPPKVPGNMAGGPPGPGASPAMAPGAGAGNEAMADGLVKSIMPTLHKALAAYPLGSKKYQSLSRAIMALAANFGKEGQQGLVPAAIQQMAQNAKQGGPLQGAPPPPMAGADADKPPPPTAPGPM